MARRVKSVTVSGYKSIREVELALGPITVLVGPNGAGKSNFIEAVELLGRIADGDLRMEVGLRGGAEAMLHDGAKGPAARIRLRVEAGEGNLDNAYEAVLVPAAQGELVFEREVVEFHDTALYEQPWNRIIGRGNRESRLSEVAGEGPREAGGVARHTLSTLRGCRVYHFHDTTPNAPVKQAGYASDLEKQVKAAGGPGLVNDGPRTAPSKRILKAYPGYHKVVDGPDAIELLGLDALRAVCPHLDAWLGRLESSER